jgi:class 3 adenylate cyclase
VAQLFTGGNQRMMVTVTRMRPGADERVNLELTVFQVQECHVMACHDITERVRYSRLIESERERSDQLLARILPASLVKRVAHGEAQITYLVPSATMLFADIVSFTPWCGRTPVAQVMTTLDNLFGRLDDATANYPLVTKIKCIGDCYFCAGGIMEEQVGRELDHASDVVGFALDILTQMTELNAEVGESLEIRVGVHTGGPIVVGVLGVEKPTFEILGSAIAMAQQMEHNGMPMRVHISEGCAAAIRRDVFQTYDPRTIDVKGGTVKTWFVRRAPVSRTMDTRSFRSVMPTPRSPLASG